MSRLRVAEASSGDSGVGDVVVSEPSHDRLGAFIRQGLVGGFRADVVGMAFHRVIHVGWFAAIEDFLMADFQQGGGGFANYRRGDNFPAHS